MTRTLPIAAAVAALAAGLGSAPAAAQSQPGDRVNTVIIYGDDECPTSTGDTITVCARLDESERYRIPPNLRFSNSPENESWSERVRSLETVGDFGPLSCTPVGAGGELGCTLEMIERAYEERESGSTVRFAELIAAERAERLSTIDAEAAAMQARVEELEEAELQRRRQAQAQPVGAEVVDPDAPPPEILDPDRVPPGDLPAQPLDDGEDEGPRPIGPTPQP
ncbi:hypothetical protein [Aurantiacibacter gangjinensis]|uniref:hypothetical protein n=1 Tax=Aurantiacibacter gangjinensis TaxID=502682 RepID=UPI0007ED5139|nr:hypothetical protein [Aurantiacibacter gangjinensis]APE27561.1 hypothetical protein BMF35_a0732 [Aurantiacibacter gangjinensis]